MKKARIFLTALTVLALVGGALAFKAKKAPLTYAKCDLNANPKVCTIDIIQTHLTPSTTGTVIDRDVFGNLCTPVEGTQDWTCTRLVTTFKPE